MLIQQSLSHLPGLALTSEIKLICESVMAQWHFTKTWDFFCIYWMAKGLFMLQITFALPLLFPRKLQLRFSLSAPRVIWPKPNKSLVSRFISVY